MFGWAVQWLSVFFYANNRLLASTLPACLQAALGVFTDMIYSVGLPTNVNKMVGVVFQPCCMAGGHLEAAYEIIMTGL